MKAGKTSCLILGSGWMAQEYLKAAKYVENLDVSFYAPSERNKAAIEALGGKFYTDLNKALTEKKPTHVVLANSVESLGPMTIKMLEMGVRDILIEKPAYIRLQEGLDLIKRAEGARVYIAYNRRYYAAATKALEMIKNNNEKFKGVQFEFTELASDVANSTKFSDDIKAHWAFGNSAHVIDFAFFPIGLPRLDSFTSYKVGSLPWHPTASEMVGSGISEKGLPFSYTAYWGGVGRWSVEWVTDKTRYIFRPMEKLQIQKLGSFSYEEVPLDWKFEGSKHGLAEQLEAFINGKNPERLLKLQDSVQLHKVISKMVGKD